MRIAVHSEAEARRASLRKPLPDGQYLARIVEAFETTSKAGNDMIELRVVVRGKDGDEREFRDWLVGNDRGALKLRHAAEAVGALAKYEAGEIGQDDFPGHDVRVKIIVEKRRGYPDQNRIEDYARHDR
ncbi:MAG: hypothetical protein B7Z80_08640 [Rhodospirillales bacterium 20-64-7]|nr:MAG: hypothetical protein B7Z80_08640 [Rhodospirillales bacterium 20-64-7]